MQSITSTNTSISNGVLNQTLVTQVTVSISEVNCQKMCVLLTDSYTPGTKKYFTVAACARDLLGKSFFFFKVIIDKIYLNRNSL